MQVAPVVEPFDFAQLMFGMAVEVSAIAMKRVTEEHFSRKPRDSDPLVLEELDALQKRCVSVHGLYAAAPSSPWPFSFSV